MFSLDVKLCILVNMQWSFSEKLVAYTLLHGFLSRLENLKFHIIKIHLKYGVLCGNDWTRIA